MLRILFVLGPDVGQIHLSLAPATYLQQRGHEVGFYCALDIREPLDKAGFHSLIWWKEERPKDTLTLKRGQLLAKQLQDPDWIKGFVQAELLDHVEQSVPPLRRVVREWKPNIIVVSPVVYEGIIVAEQERIPWATYSASMSPFMPEMFKSQFSEQIELLAKPRAELFKNFGVNVEFSLAECLSPRLNLSFMTDEVLGNRTNPRYKRVGPSIPPGARGDECEFPWDQLSDDLPIIYFSMGKRTYYQVEALNTFFKAIAGKPVQAVCMVGDLAGSRVLEEVPDNVLLARYVPQMTFLPAASALVTHGGATSVMEALYFGVPMLVSPIWYDHVYQAHFIDKCGVGLKAELAKDSAVETWRSLDSLLNGNRFKEKAGKISLSYKKHDGGVEAARLIVRAAVE